MSAEKIIYFNKIEGLIDFLKEKNISEIFVSFKFDIEKFQINPRQIEPRTMVLIRLSLIFNSELIICNQKYYGTEMPNVIPFLLQCLDDSISKLKKNIKEIKIYNGIICSPLEDPNSFLDINWLIENERLRNLEKPLLKALAELFDDIEDDLEIADSEIESELKKIFDYD